MDIVTPSCAILSEKIINDTNVRYNYTLSELVIHRATEGIIGLSMIFSAFTNAIVIYVLLNKKFGKRTTIKYLYAHISLSDELFILSSVISVLLYDQSSCSLDCRRFLGVTVTISGFVSAYTMVLIAFKRYIGIAFPFKELSQNQKKLPYIIAIVVIWTFSIGATMYFMRYVEICQYKQTLLLQQCTMLSYVFVALKEDPYYPLVGMVIVPLALGLLFSLMSIVILQKRQFVGDHVDIARLKKSRQDKLKSTFMIAVVIVGFMISWFPITLLALVYTINLSKMELCDLNYIAYAILTALLMLSFWINPIIYWYMSPQFRRGITQIFKKGGASLSRTNAP